MLDFRRRRFPGSRRCSCASYSHGTIAETRQRQRECSRDPKLRFRLYQKLGLSELPAGLTAALKNLFRRMPPFGPVPFGIRHWKSGPWLRLRPDKPARYKVEPGYALTYVPMFITGPIFCTKVNSFVTQNGRPTSPSHEPCQSKE